MPKAKTRPKLPREECLETARRIISGNREEQYSGPEDSFRQIAEHWNAYLRRRLDGIDSSEVNLGASDVAVMMTLLKLARLTTGGANQPDTWVDVAGYAGCGYEVSVRD
jgi:hypothetical protein